MKNVLVLNILHNPNLSSRVMYSVILRGRTEKDFWCLRVDILFRFVTYEGLVFT